MGVEKLAALCHHLVSAYLERAEEVEGAIVALGAKQHMLMIGPPGTAKSALIGDLARAVSGVTYFEWQVTKYTTPDELFGPLSLKGLESDSYRRITAGKAPEACIMFLDEVFKANSSILNSLLSLINERKFYNDGQPTAAPLVSLFGASNELPQGDEETALAAFADRFLLRYKVDYLAEDGDFAALLRMSQGQPAPQVTAQDLLDYQQAAEAVKVPDEVVEAMVQLRRELAHEGITASDRRWRQSLSALKARAALNGATEVKIDRDFDLLVHVLWQTPDQKKQVAKVVRKTADPIAERVDELADEAKEVYNAAMTSKETAQGMEANKKLKEIIKALEGIAPQAALGSQPRVLKAIETITSYNKEVIKVCLGVQ